MRTLGPCVSNDLSSKAGSFSYCRLNPHRCFQSEVWGFISPHLGKPWVFGALGCAVCAPPPFLPVYLCTNVGPQGLLAVALPAEFVPQSATSLGPAALSEVLSALAACLRPSYRCGWMFLLYILGCRTFVQFDFLSVLVVFLFLNCCCPSFGCARRCSVSTYASILAGSSWNYFLNHLFWVTWTLTLYWKEEVELWPCMKDIWCKFGARFLENLSILSGEKIWLQT